MGKLYEDGFKWFVEALKRSTSSDNYVEIANGELQIESASQLLIKSSAASIKVSFCVDRPSYSIMSYPNMSKDALKVMAAYDGTAYKISVVEDRSKMKNCNAIISFNIQYGLTLLGIESDMGDISLDGCNAKETSIITVSGDIHVRNHVSPCTVKAKSTHGDITKNGFTSKTSTHLLRCKTIDGDILLSNSNQ